MLTMADVTNVFKATAKAIKSRNKAFNESYTEQPTANNNDILGLGKKQGGSDFETKAKNLVHMITKLRDFLLENRKNYVNAGSLLSNKGQDMSESERDQIDNSAQEIIKKCKEMIILFRVETDGHKAHPQVREHRNAVMILIEAYLKTICKIYSEQKAVRVKRVVDRNRISKLEPERKHSNLTRSQLKRDLKIDGKEEKVSIDVNSSEKRLVDDVPKDHLFEHHSYEPEIEISSEEAQMFEEENKILYEEMNSMVEEVKQIEGQVVEIAKLQEIFTEKILEQDVQINTIANTVVGTTENIKDANEEIREVKILLEKLKVPLHFKDIQINSRVLLNSTGETVSEYMHLGSDKKVNGSPRENTDFEPREKWTKCTITKPRLYCTDMPFSCQVCDSEQYDEEDGLFYCTECGTQSQELIVQEVNDTCTDVGVRYEVKSAKKSTSSIYRPKADLGRPWMIYEAYQIIILAQADALISLGAKQELKDTVFTLWANYLSRLGIAFCKDEQPVANIVKKMRVGRLRELHRGTFENPRNRKKRPFHENLSGVKSATDEAKKVDFYEEDTPIFEGKDNIVFIIEDDCSKNHEARYNKASQSPEWMNITKTISLCYIGLMFTDPEILPYDLLRWVYESKVPYLSTTHLLPNDMVLSAGDQALFETNRFDTSTFIREINKLLAYLELKNMSSPDLKMLISRFVKELHLPEELACISCRLVNKVPFINNSHSVYSKKEVLAMGYIILAVKLVFGLNDDTEWSLSKYSKKIQDLVKQEIKLFVWSDWKKFMIRKCLKNFNAYRELTSDLHKSKLCHLDQLLACYTDTQIDKKRLTTWSTLNSKQRLVHRFEAEFKDSLRKPLEIALTRFDASQSYMEVSETHDLDYVRMKLHEDFTCATVAHIVNVDEFKDKIREIATDMESELYKMIFQYSREKPVITQYGYLTREEDLVHNRHDNYLWFLHIARETIDCKVLELDKLTVRLTDYLVTASSGVDMSGLVCAWFGNFQKNFKRQTETIDASQDLFE